MGLAHLLYIVSAVFIFLIGKLFFDSKDGIERKIMYSLFWSISFGLILRGFAIIIPPKWIDYYKDLIPILIVTPLTCTSIIGYYVLSRKYKK